MLPITVIDVAFIIRRPVTIFLGNEGHGFYRARRLCKCQTEPQYHSSSVVLTVAVEVGCRGVIEVA